MKKKQGIALLLCLLLALSPLTAAAQTESTQTEAVPEETEPEVSAPTEAVPTEPLPEEMDPALWDTSVSMGCRSINAQVPLYTLPEDMYSSSVMLYEVNTETMLYSQNPDTPMDPTSLVKIVNLLLAVEYGGEEELVTVTSSALAAVPKNAITVNLQAGEQLLLKDLLHCMITGSGNDAAAVIAEHVAGSQDMFVAKMNQRIREIGCQNTRFVDATGLDSNQLTTARDMCRILIEAMENPKFMEYFGTTKYTVPATEMSAERKLETTNYMMLRKYTFYNTHVTGGRTGITSDNLRALATTAEGNGMKYVAVVLGAKTSVGENTGTVFQYGNYEDTRRLYEQAFENMHVVRVLSPEQILDQYPVRNGDNHVAVGSDRAITITVPKDTTLDDFTIKFMEDAVLAAPISLGQRLATVQLWLGSACVAQLELVARNPVEQAYKKVVDTWAEVEKGPDFLMMAIVLLVVAVIFSLSALVLFAVRKTQALWTRRNSKRRRRDRRRSK